MFHYVSITLDFSLTVIFQSLRTGLEKLKLKTILLSYSIHLGFEALNQLTQGLNKCCSLGYFFHCNNNKGLSQVGKNRINYENFDSFN